ncbi:MAG: outer membrane family protein [Candidatus Xenolissoclinum pacificiensis L6]|uniref:Outer membrane family protein n=1 Tax=Candidatus Xenolissoclinum pacificiensis L6 TaxID=1401685 RepID=W2V0X5_9RICK|nr:MAG: outer membrane family protein [Candidatus Xenolissoclinum pacificiensis L6]
MNILKRTAMVAIFCSIIPIATNAKSLYDEVAVVYPSKVFANSEQIKKFEKSLTVCTQKLAQELGKKIEHLESEESQLHENKDMMDHDKFEEQREEIHKQRNQIYYEFQMIEKDNLQKLQQKIFDVSKNYFQDATVVVAKKHKKSFVHNADAVVYFDSKYIDLTDAVSEVFDRNFQTQETIKMLQSEFAEIGCDIDSEEN